MSEVIAFIEKMGQDAKLRHASQQDVRLALAGTGIESGVQAAILSGDESLVAQLLGNQNTCCAYFFEDTDETESHPCIEECA
jgi:hypothetical protein